MADARTTRPLLLGHRGARRLRSIRENTIAAFDRALADGCDGFELDVRLTADGVPVIFHDPAIGGVRIARARAEKLAKLPTLQQVLERYAGSAFLDIELKVPGLQRLTVDLLKQFPPTRGCVVSSFLPLVLKGVHELDPEIPLGLICENKRQMRLWATLPVEYVIPHYRLVTAALVQEFAAAGKKIMVWTVNARAHMKQQAGYGVHGIISDKTALLCSTLAS